jgi:hypothetical protein
MTQQAFANLVSPLPICKLPEKVQGAPGKLADAKLHLADGPLAWLKLVGFAIWQLRCLKARR